MSYHDTVDALAGDPEQLEDAYHSALKAGQADAFRQAIEAGHAAAPDNLLFAAWFHRLKHTAAQAKSAAVAWGWVIPLALANGLIFWWLSDDQRFGITLAGPFPGPKYSFIPAIFLLVAPIAAAFVLTYLTAAGPRTAPAGRRWLLSGIISLALIAASAYVLLVYPQAGTRPYQEQYLTLMASTCRCWPGPASACSLSPATATRSTASPSSSARWKSSSWAACSPSPAACSPGSAWACSPPWA
jgi:hypothetical protein